MLNEVAKAALAYRRTRNKYSKIVGIVAEVDRADKRIKKAGDKLKTVMAQAREAGFNKLQIETAVEHGDNVAAGIDYPNWK